MSLQSLNPSSVPPSESEPDPELDRITAEEEACLARVLSHLEERRKRPASVPSGIDYDAELISLRDQIGAARLEDVPPLVEQMERLQMLAVRRREVAQGAVDHRSPYFGHLVLEEQGRRREVLIGRSTYLDTQSGVRIVDWRDAPVSRIYYRYDEGDEYDEVFGEREVNGVVVTRRSVTITESTLRRIVAPQGSFLRTRDGRWRRLPDNAVRLSGGEGTAPRPEQHQRIGRLGVGSDTTGIDDKHLREITPLIDSRQFELITRPDSGLVVIQGGAGSGKTTIGLHRLAYLAFQDPRRFRPDRMLVVVFNDALARYMSQVLPALGIEGVAIRTYEDWAARLRAAHLPRLPDRYSETTPGEVTRLKKHPAMLRIIDDYIAQLEQQIGRELGEALEKGSSRERGSALLAAWTGSAGRPLAHRLHHLKTRLEQPSLSIATDARVGVERLLRNAFETVRDVGGAWADLLTDRATLANGLAKYAPGAFSVDELNRAHAWCTARCTEVLTEREERLELARAEPVPKRKSKAPPRPASDEDSEIAPTHGIDGRELHEAATMDREDDTLLLRLVQRMHGPLRRGSKNKDPIVYEHVFIDEAQDLSPVELAVVIDTVSKAQSVTLAGDVAQRLLMDNGFTNWNEVLSTLALRHVEVEPLRLSYRSTRQIIDFAQAVLGPLASDEPAPAIRDGANIELFEFAHSGDAVGFLAEALRDLVHSEPRASVAVIARYSEHADIYYHGLKNAELPLLRRIADQDFPFRPGIDVTDVRQVKGLEFDYVVLVEVSDAAYPVDDEARHLLHIGATRAAHQLWVLVTGKPSQLLPESLREHFTP